MLPFISRMANYFLHAYCISTILITIFQIPLGLALYYIHSFDTFLHILLLFYPPPCSVGCDPPFGGRVFTTFDSNTLGRYFSLPS